MTKYIGILFCVLLGQVAWTQNAHELLQEGDMMYLNKNYEEAEKLYDEASKVDASQKAAYNLGNTYFKKGDVEKAIEQYEKAARSPSDEVRYRSAYNKGVAQYNSQDFQGAMESFKEAIKLSDDEQAKENFLKSKLMVQQQQKQQQQQQQQNQNQQSKEDKDQQEDQEGSQSQQQSKEGEQEQGEQQNDQNDSSNEEEQSQDGNEGNDQNQASSKGEQKEGELDQKELQKLLDMAEDAEKKVQENLKRNNNNLPPKKDW